MNETMTAKDFPTNGTTSTPTIPNVEGTEAFQKFCDSVRDSAAEETDQFGAFHTTEDAWDEGFDAGITAALQYLRHHASVRVRMPSAEPAERSEEK